MCKKKRHAQELKPHQECIEGTTYYCESPHIFTLKINKYIYPKKRILLTNKKEEKSSGRETISFLVPLTETKSTINEKLFLGEWSNC